MAINLNPKEPAKAVTLKSDAKLHEDQVVVLNELYDLEQEFMKELLRIRMKSNHCKRWMLEGRTQVQLGLMSMRRAFSVPEGD